MPTEMGRECCFADSMRPWTKGDWRAGVARDLVSSGEEPM